MEELKRLAEAGLELVPRPAKASEMKLEGQALVSEPTGETVLVLLVNFGILGVRKYRFPVNTLKVSDEVDTTPVTVLTVVTPAEAEGDLEAEVEITVAVVDAAPEAEEAGFAASLPVVIAHEAEESGIAAEEPAVGEAEGDLKEKPKSKQKKSS